MLSGEIVAVIENVPFMSKHELLAKLRIMRQNTMRLSQKDRRVVKQMLGIAIQQVFHTPEKVLLEHAN